MTTWQRVRKFFRNIMDDIAIVAVTAAGILLRSYWPSIRDVLVNHHTEVELPSWVATAVALVIAVVVAAIDANTGDPDGRKMKRKQRLGKHIMVGLGALSLMEAAMGPAT